jgi:CRP/FNR family transcriptional regulator, nitrogen oxide reductase regulator
LSLPRLDPSLLSGFPLFGALSRRDLEAILVGAHVRRLAPDEPVFRQGEEAGEFFVLLSGRLKVVRTAPDGSQVVVRHVNPGDIFGIAQALGRSDYPGTALALTESLALAWPNGRWEGFTMLNPAFTANVFQTVGQRLQEAHSRIHELATEEVERRVAHAVLRLVNQAGVKVGDGIRIDIPITRQDIAEMTGTTLHTVSRVMSAWEQKGLVVSSRKSVTVCDPHRLLLIADGRAEGGG